MDARRLKATRQRLTNEHERLTKSINRGRLAAEAITVDKTEDEGDLATLSHDRELSYNLQEGDFSRLRLIEGALESLDRGEYGVCVSCGEDINEKRLEVLPWARMCIRCQGEAELETSSRMLVGGFEGDGPEV
jgi:RNA polymerase-binding transcription factor